jgi:AraC-like DNA-binding protein
LEKNLDILQYQRVWENSILPQGYHIEKQLSCDPMIFFVITGSVRFKINNGEAHSIFPHEMFMAQIDDSYEVTMLEPTHLIICHVPFESWYAGQKWIERLAPAENNSSDIFYKLPVKKTLTRFLALVDVYIKDGIHSPQFFENVRHELFYLLFHYYLKPELAQFLQCILSKDIQFKKFVVSNYLKAGNVEELAKLANYSTSGFIKKFQKCFNDSPYKWIQRQKAKQISIDIYNGVKSLQEIANEYKFSSYQHFSVFCKTQLGAPPSTIYWEKSKINGQLP